MAGNKYMNFDSLADIPQPDYGDIWIVGRSPQHLKPNARYSSTTPDAPAEVSIMTNYLELESAQRLRGVVIPPHAVGSLIVVSPGVSLWALIRGFLKERPRARKAAQKGGA